MSDEDRAQDLELREWMHNNKPRGKVDKHQPGDDGYGPEFCNRCDAKMPTARREHGFKICVECKSADELRLARSH